MSEDGLLREELVQWVTRYQDAAERNALAETPEESADYLLSLLPPVRDLTIKEIGEWLWFKMDDSDLAEALPADMIVSILYMKDNGDMPKD